MGCVLLFTSCSDDYESESELIVNKKVEQDSTVLANVDTSALVKDIIYSPDSSMLYVVEQDTNGTVSVISSVETKGETVEVIDWFGTIILFIALLIFFD